MKAVKSRKILLVIAMTLVLSLTVGLTMAYFSDHAKAEGGSSLVLGGSTKVIEKIGENSKSVKIQNTGETNVVVKVAIYGPSGMNVIASNSWEKKDGFYYYKGVLEPGETTPEGSLEAKVTLPADGDLGNEYQIVVVQECAQVTYELKDGKNVVAKPDGWNHIPTIVVD